VELKSAFAPRLFTLPGRDPLARPSGAVSEPRVLDAAIETWRRAGVNGARLRLLSDECMEHDGDLVLPSVRLRVSLVVKGSLKIGAGSHLEGDVKAVESMRIGPHSVCVGHLTAGQHVTLGIGTTFSGVIYAERSVRLDVGCRSEGAQVAVHGDTTVTLADSVSISGKVSAGDRVVTV
jgi:cytoskeletal protein CcmA (bactofilin family)